MRQKNITEEDIVLYILCCSFLLSYLLYGSALACFLMLSH